MSHTESRISALIAAGRARTTRRPRARPCFEGLVRGAASSRPAAAGAAWRGTPSPWRDDPAARKTYVADGGAPPAPFLSRSRAVHLLRPARVMRGVIIDQRARSRARRQARRPNSKSHFAPRYGGWPSSWSDAHGARRESSDAFERASPRPRPAPQPKSSILKFFFAGFSFLPRLHATQRHDGADDPAASGRRRRIYLPPHAARKTPLD